MTILEASVSVSDSIERCDSNPSAPPANGKAANRTLSAAECSGERSWAVPHAPSGGCRNTGVHHVGLHASNPAARRHSTRMFSAWRSSAGVRRTILSAPRPS